ncbi:hypothetical protein [Coleofasciculus sp. H7-2]
MAANIRPQARSLGLEERSLTRAGFVCLAANASRRTFLLPNTET